MSDSAVIPRSVWLARWLALAFAAALLGQLQQFVPCGPGSFYLTAAAYGLPVAAAILSGRWGWTAVLVGGAAGAATVPSGWVSVVAATVAAAFACYRSRRWPPDPGLGRLSDIAQLARLAVETAAVKGLCFGLLASFVSDRVGVDGITVAQLELAGGVVLGAVAGGVRARSTRPLVAVVPAVVAVILLVLTYRAAPTQPLSALPAAIWWGGSLGVAASALGLLALVSVTRERLAEGAMRDRLLTELKTVSADLIRRRASMEALLDQLPVGVLFLEAGGHVVRQNRQYRDGLKLPTDFPELRSDGPSDSGRWQVARADGSLVPAADWSVYRAVREGRPAAGREARVLAADGVWRDVSVNSAPVVDPDSGSPGSVFVVSDQTARKQAERDRQAAEDRLRGALDSARMYAWEWDPVTDRLEVFGDFRRVVGLPADHPVPTSVAELVALTHPDDRADRIRTIAGLRAGRDREYESEYRLVRPDGSVVWVKVRGQMVSGPDGTPTGRYAGVTFDVTAQKLAEERAAEAEARAGQALTAARMCAWEWDLETGRASRSESIQAWLGLPGEDALDHRHLFLDRIHPDDRALIVEQLPDRIASGEDFGGDYRIQHADGSWRWLRSRGRATLGPSGRPVSVAGVHIDVTAEKSAEERLRLLESAVVHARDAIIILDADPAAGAGRSVRYVNAGFERMTGYTPAEVIGRSLSFLGGPKSDPQALARLRTALDAGQPLVTELLNYHRDGAEVWVELSLVPVPAPSPAPDGSERISHFVMIQRDITDRKRAEAVVRESEERLRMIGDSLPDGAVFQLIQDPTGRLHIPYISAGVERLIGLPSADIVADAGKLLDRMSVEDRGLFADRKARSAAELSTCEMEFRFMARDGRDVTCYARSQPARLPGGGVLWNGVLLDVTARRRAEEALRQSEFRFRGMFESASAGVSETGPDGRFTAVNPAFAGLLGRLAEEIIGQSPEAFTHPDDWEAQRPVLDEVQAGSRDKYRLTKRYLRPGGTVVWTELSAAVLRDTAGRVQSILGVSVDVTERQLLEEQLLQAQKMEAVGQLAGGIAHDFNNLLTGVIGHLGIIALPPSDPNRKHLLSAERAAHRAAELTRKLLGFARKNQLLLAPVPASDCVTEVLDLIRPTLGLAVELVVESDTEDLILADPALIGQVVLNLCLNAKDAMPGGGTLTIRTEAVEVSAAEAAAHPHGQAGPHVRIRVADTGTGIPTDVLARVFEPFFTTKGVGKGTGLGLPMVDGIVRQHGGWVAVSSEVGKGTTFDVYLRPASKLTGAGQSTALKRSTTERVISADLTDTPPPRPAAARLAPTVLLVDDEEMIRLLGRNVLEGAGYTVLEAEDGADALTLFRDRHAEIDLVVMDLTMPRMSGRDAFRAMADISPSARVLLSSGFSSDDLSDVAGAVGLLAKPYRPAELVAAVRRALDRPDG